MQIKKFTAQVKKEPKSASTKNINDCSKTLLNKQTYEKMQKILSTGKITRLLPQPFANVQFDSGLESLYETSELHKTLNTDGSVRNKQLFKSVSIVIETDKKPVKIDLLTKTKKNT